MILILSSDSATFITNETIRFSNGTVHHLYRFPFVAEGREVAYQRQSVKEGAKTVNEIDENGEAIATK